MDIQDYIEELLLAAGYSKSEIMEMDLPEMRMNIGWDWNWINNFLTLNNNKMETLNNLLKKHDWFYSRSEDHSKWINGLASEEAIQDEMKRLGNTTEVQELYENSKPEVLREALKIAS